MIRFKEGIQVPTFVSPLEEKDSQEYQKTDHLCRVHGYNSTFDDWYNVNLYTSANSSA